MQKSVCVKTGWLVCVRPRRLKKPKIPKWVDASGMAVRVRAEKAMSGEEEKEQMFLGGGGG